MSPPDTQIRFRWLALVGTLGGLAMYRPIYSIDLGMHLAAGRWILAHGAVPSRDPLSFTAFGEPWIVHEWLAQVVLALVERPFGLEGLKVAAALLCGLASAVFFTAFRRRGLSSAGALAACLLILWLFESRFRLRPHLVTLLGAALLYASPPLPWGRRRILCAGLFYLAWLNSHGGWLLVPVHFATLAACKAWGRQPGEGVRLVLAASLLLSLLNPRGVALPVSAWRISEVADLIPEWASAFALGRDFRAKAMVAACLAAASLTLLVARLARRDPDAEGLAPIVWSQPFGLLSQRFLFLQPLCLPALVRIRLARRVRPAFVLALLVPLFAITQGERWLKLARLPGGPAADWIPGRFPEACAGYLAREGLGGDVLCPPAWSGYLMARLGDAIRVAIDGRVELFGAERARQIPALFERPTHWPEGLDPDLAVIGKRYCHPHLAARYRSVFVGPVGIVLRRK